MIAHHVTLYNYNGVCSIIWFKNY